MKYINKKTNLFVLIVSSLLLCIFTGCSNLTDGESKSNEVPKTERQITVTGKIFSETGRSANTSFTLTEAHSINIWATQEKSGSEPLSEVAQITGNTYTLKLTQYGDWTIHLYITCENKDGQESVLVNLSKDISISEDDSSITLTEPFVINSGYSTVHNGGIRLAFEDESGKIFNMTYSATLRVPETGNENSLKDGGPIYFSTDFHDAGLQLDNVAPNSYEVTFCFNDIKGNTLYSCKEIITVLAGFTTDTWIGEGAHLRKDRYGTTKFVITNSLIDSFGTEVVPDTDYILYNYNSSQTQYYVTGSLNSIDSQSVNVEGNKSNQYAFDKDGNIYFLITSDSGKTIKKGNENYTYTNDVTTDRILIDRKNNVLYGCQINGMTLDLYKFDYFISGPDEKRNEYKTLSGYSFPSDVFGDWYYHDSEVLTIYDGILYGANSMNKLFYKLDLNKAESVAEKIDLSLKDYIDNSYLSNCNFSDIIYQDGYIYILIRNVREDSSTGLDFYSRGGVLCFNTFTNSVEKFIGWTDSTLSNDAYTYLSYRGLVKDADDNYVLAKTSDIVQKYTDEYEEEKTKSLFNIYCPEYEDEGFYGPEKFIAIKPKKLVIADNGLAYYTDDNDAYRVKNLNRVVTVDLETFALEVSEVDSSIKFASETTNGSGYLSGNACMYASIPSDTPLYKSSDKSQMTADEIKTIMTDKRPSYPNEGMFPDMEIGGGVPAIPFDTTTL